MIQGCCFCAISMRFLTKTYSTVCSADFKGGFFWENQFVRLGKTMLGTPHGKGLNGPEPN